MSLTTFAARYETAEGPNEFGLFMAETQDEAVAMFEASGATRVLEIEPTTVVAAKRMARRQARINRAYETGDLDFLFSVDAIGWDGDVLVSR